MPLLSVKFATEPRQSGLVADPDAAHGTGGSIQHDSAKCAQAGTQQRPPYAPECRDGCGRNGEYRAGERGSEPAPARHVQVMVERLSRRRRGRRHADGGGRVASRWSELTEWIRLWRPWVCHSRAPVGLLNSAADRGRAQESLITPPYPMGDGSAVSRYRGYPPSNAYRLTASRGGYPRATGRMAREGERPHQAAPAAFRPGRNARVHSYGQRVFPVKDAGLASARTPTSNRAAWLMRSTGRPQIFGGLS